MSIFMDSAIPISDTGNARDFPSVILALKVRRRVVHSENQEQLLAKQTMVKEKGEHYVCYGN